MFKLLAQVFGWIFGWLAPLFGAKPQSVRPRSGSVSAITTPRSPPSTHVEPPRPNINHLLRNNKLWAKAMLNADPEFFSSLAKLQKPKYLWIGCSDSRVPANQILGLPPGGVFVHANVANLVVSTDLNMLSVLQYAVEKLGVEHILVCGHYDCGGVKASLQPQALGLIDNWLRNIRDVVRLYQEELMAITDDVQRGRRLVELNTLEQALNILKTGIVQKRRRDSKQERGISLPKVHAVVYSVEDGILHELDLDTVKSTRKYGRIYSLLGDSEDLTDLFALEGDEKAITAEDSCMERATKRTNSLRAKLRAGPHGKWCC